jgi:hypothetical protein
MKAIMRVTEKITIEVEASKLEELLPHMTAVNEFFQDTECGACKSKNIGVNVRNSGGFEFIEMSCNKCSARLCYGKTQKEKALYPVRWERVKEGEVKGVKKGSKRRDKDGNVIWLPNNGWTKYTPQDDEE